MRNMWVPTSRRSDESGMVTAEAALTLPIVMAVVLLLAWLVSLGLAEVRVVDAARDGARQASRGDLSQLVRQAAERTAPDGARVAIARHGDTVAVTVSVRVRSPRWLLVPLPSAQLESTSTVEVEGRAPRH